MKIFGNVSALYLVLLGWAAYAHAADNREWKLGKVLDSQAAKTYVVSSASSNDWAGNGTEVQVRHMAIQSTQLMILGAEYSYVIDDSVEKAVGLQLQGRLTRALANRKHGCRYIVGDAIQYAQEKNSLYVRDADGKECKVDIVRQERVHTPNAVQPSPDRSTSPSQTVAALRPVDKPQVQKVAEPAQAGSAALPKVRFTSSPTGAEVSIDGEYYGSTPTSEVGQKEGTHIVRIKKRCYLPWERTITLRLGDARTVLAELDLEPADPTKPRIVGLCDAQ